MTDSQTPKSRLNDPVFLQEIRNLLAIEFGEYLEAPGRRKLFPNPMFIVGQIRTGHRIHPTTYFEQIVNKIVEDYQLMPFEARQLHGLLFFDE